MPLRSLVPILVAAVLVTGCTSISSTLTIRPDGSGTITQRVLLPGQLSMMMRSLQQSGDSTAPTDGLFTEEKIRERAESMSGARLTSVEMIADETGDGYEATYTFDNLNDLDYDPSPEHALPDDADGSTEDNPSDLLSGVDYSFEPGPPAILTVHMPRTQDSEIDDDSLSFDPPAEQFSSPNESEMMRQLLRDSGIQLTIRVEGTIVETNATHRSGSTVTLIDVNFGTLVQDSTAFARMMDEQHSMDTSPEALETLNSFPGITIEPRETVTIRFQ